MKKSVLQAVSMALAVLIALSGFPARPASAAAAKPVYDVDISDVDQQTVKGWGIFPSWNRADWTRDFISATGAQQALFGDLGATLFRITIPAVAGDGDGNLIDAKMQEIYDLVHAGETKGMHDYIISVWSPPIGMKTLPTVNGWTGTEHVRLRTDKEEAYTDYLVKAIQWLTDHGASVPKALSFQNEPLSQIISEWCYWGGDNGAQYQRVAKLLRSKLDAAGLTDVQLLGPEGAAYYENELLLGQDFSALSSDPELYDAIGGLASHSYFAKGYDNDGVYQNYRDVVNLFPEKDKWETEYSTLISGVSEMDMAINASQRLASDMALVGNNYWFWWLGWANGRHPTDVGEVLLDGDGVTVTKSKAFYVLSKIFNNVPVGSKVRRVAADPASGLVTSEAVWMDAVAFVDGTKTVALLVNSTEDDKTVNVNGLTGTTADVYQLTSDVALGDDMKLAAKRNIKDGTAQVVELPAKSVSVIVTSDTDTAPPHIAFDQSGSATATDADYAVRSSAYTVSGHLDEAGTLTINGQPVDVEGDLSFSTAVTLVPGANTITAVAEDALGNEGDPVTLFVRYDPAYLGLSLDQSGTSYVRESDYAVSGRTNGSATVNVKHQFGGETVSESNFHVGGEDSGGGTPGGELVRQLFDDNYVSTVYNLADTAGGFTTIANGTQSVRDDSAKLATADGSAYSLRLKLNAGFSRFGLSFADASSHAVLEDYAAQQPTAALQFQVYTKQKKDSFSAVVESDDNGTIVEARIPLSSYIAASDYGNKWTQVTIPLSAFDAAAHYDADGNASELPISWDKLKGFGFSSNEAAFYDPQVDDIHLVTLAQGGDDTPPPDPSSLLFSTDLNLQVGDNTVTASAYNASDQHAVPATIHVIYDPNPPVLSVPASGSTTGTSYVLNGSVNEQAVIKVNGVQTTLKPDLSFTSVVPVVKGANTITVTAEDPAGNLTTSVVNVDSDPVEDGSLAPGVAAASPTETAPVIDGDLAESGWVVNNRVEGMVTGTSDNNITFGTMWDASKLYVAVKVLDADLKNDSDPAKTYLDDSVELYIDGDNSRSSVYGSDDHQITLGWHDTELSVGGDIEGIAFAQKDIEGGFTVEMAIPWAGIGVEPPAADSVIGFDVAYNDDDGHNNGDRESQLMWRGNGDNWRSTTAFGSLILSDGKNTEVAREPSGALTVDGKLDEPYWALRRSVTQAITGTSNNAVRFGTLSDMQNLYVGIEVLDADLKNDSEQQYQDDSVEIYLDADHNQGATYDAKDRQITVRWHDDEIGIIGGALEGLQVAQQDISGGYTVEVAIPWSSLGVTPARDIMLGLDIGNNDDDGGNAGNRESQLMWNGTGNNWRDTSGFGNLLNHNLSLGLPDNSEPDPEGLLEFADDAADLSKLYDMSANIVPSAGHPENFNDDATRLTHNVDNPTSPEYVVYKSPEGDVYSFDVTTGLYSTTPQFTIYGSADGVNYSKITMQSTLIGGANAYSVYSNTASKLPEGTRYLKIQFPGMANWMEQLLGASFKYFGNATTPPDDSATATFTDEAGDLTKLFGKSDHISTNAGGDGSRMLHTNDDSLEPEYVIYQSPDGDIRSFDVNVTNWVGLPDTVGFTVEGSADGTSFAPIDAATTYVGTESGYDTLSVNSDNVPSGIRYLKIVFPYGDAACDNWTSFINKVMFDYVDTNADTGAGPVSATAVLNGPSSGTADAAYDLTFGLADVTGDIVAEDLKIVYDPAAFASVTATKLADGFGIVGQSAGEGVLRLILASSGTANAVSADGDLLKLSFIVNPLAATGDTTITVTNNVITNVKGEEAQLPDVSHTALIVNVDRNDLTDLIANAQALHDAATEGRLPGQYAAGSKAALLAAIQAAQAVADNAGATQQQVNDETTALQAAIQAFEAAVNRGDLNGDGSFTIGDLGLIIGIYGKTSADADWDENADTNGDGIIDIADLAKVAGFILE